MRTNWRNLRQNRTNELQVNSHHSLLTTLQLLVKNWTFTSNFTESHQWRRKKNHLSPCRVYSTSEFTVRTVWWSTALILWPTSPVQMRGRTNVIHFAGCWSTTLPQQLSSFSSFYGTHGIPRHKHKLEIDQEMSSVSSFLQCREKKSGMQLTSAVEHAQRFVQYCAFVIRAFLKLEM